MKKEVYEVLKKLEDNGFEAYLVGGYPRDYYLNKVSNDYDICTSATPEDLKEIFSQVLEENFGSLKIKVQEIILEITTFRIEKEYVSTRTPIVSFTSSLEEDLNRRDFTINTLCMDKDEKYIDHMDARKDIDDKIIKSVGDPHYKMSEDPLRILRAIRFATVLNFKIDKKLEDAIIKHKELVANLSYQRKREEIDKILKSENCTYGVNLIQKYGLDSILEFTFSKLIFVNSLEAMWAQITFSDNYPFTKQEKKKIQIIKDLISKGNIEDMDLYTYGLEISKNVSFILGENIEEIESRYNLLPIHNQSDIDITSSSIQSITPAYPSFVYLILENKIINKELQNNRKEIEKFLQSYFNETEIR